MHPSTPTDNHTDTPAGTAADAVPRRVAVVGAGTIGRDHLAALLASPTLAPSAVVDPAPAARDVADRAGVPWYATLDELLTQDRPDGVVLATPNHLHLEQALQVMAAGVPLLLEKPVTVTVAEAVTLAEAVRAAGATVLVGHHRAHSPLMARAAEVVSSGRLGRVVAVSGSATFHKPAAYFDDAPWRREPGAGPVLVNMVHEVHNLRMLCGEVAAVQAMASSAVRGHAVEDTVAISLRFASGALGSFLLSDCAASPRSWEQTSRENPAYATYDDQDCYVVSGTRGTLSVPTMRLHTTPGGEESSWFEPFEVGVVGVVRRDPIARQAEHFGQVLRGEAAPLVTVEDGLANLRVVEAIDRAARTGGVVEVPARQTGADGRLY